MISLIGRPYCQKVLPLVYDDSLSYYEQVCKLVFKVNEVIDTFNGYEEIINQLASELVDIQSIKNSVTNLQNEVSSLENRLGTLNDSIIALSKRDEQLQSQINNLTNTVNTVIAQYDGIISYIDTAVERAKLDNQQEWIEFQKSVNISLANMNRQIADLTKLVQEIGNDVYNPIRATRESLDKNNADIYNDLRYFGFTNAELSEFGISNEHVASLVHDNRDYALNAKKRFKRNYLFSPVTGKWVSHANAISQALVALFGSVVTNQMLADYMATNELSNDDLANIYETNFSRYTVSVQEGD